MRRILAVAQLPEDVDPALAVVDGCAAVDCGEPVDGRLFVCQRHGQAAVGCEINEDDAPYSLVRAAYRAKLKAVAFGDHDDGTGLYIITGMRLVESAWGGMVWADNARVDDHHERQWRARAMIAAARAACGFSCRSVPPQAGRPEGTGRPLVLDIAGDITSSMADRVVPEIKAARSRTIVVNVDSDGGSVDGGTSICRALQQHPHAVHTNITGKAHSMAALIALHGDTRSIVPDGTFMVHEPSVSAGYSMSASALRRQADSLEREAENFAAIIARQTEVHITVAREWVAAETTFNAGDAIRFGMVHALDHSTVPRKPAPIRARFHPVDVARMR